jgi:hypothetical protein
MTMPEITDETYLRCPCCTYVVWVSPEDPDASLSGMHRHLRGAHADRDARRELARAELVYL